MFKHLIKIAACMGLAAAQAKAQPLTIDSCYAMALRNYPQIRQYALIDKTRDYTLNNAAKAYLPQVSLTAIEGYVFGGFPESGGSNFKFIGLAQVNQTVWDGGATKTQKKIIEASAEADKASVDVSLHDIRSRVNQLYFGVLMVDEQLKQLAIQDSILNNNIRAVQLKSDNGLAYKTDVDEVRAEQLRLHQQRTEFSYTRSGYIKVLSLLIARPLNNEAILDKPLPAGQYAGMDIVRPELNLFKQQRNLATAQAGMQKVNLYPKLGVLGAGVLFAPGINLGPTALSSLGVLGVSASWNINGLYKNNNDKQLTTQQLNKIDVQEATFLFNTRLQLSQSAATIDKQRAILTDDESIVALRRSIREGYQVKYDNGVSPVIDLLNAGQRELDARALKALHEMQLLMTIYDYKTISGN
ncbi:TolC family protein [Flavihumibacter petaseus]|uniref:RND-type efflux pump outer membrane protein n=1 Tax=Flavihumibacter petaseus NBRC 106054 TaxID=1220578 RepID=A0A0E9MZY9_9BACT|nr:TolC family protein [Flavihumibacter petaseus]GAO43134.1 hypothetical protein FPE01S_02_02380 [Flavihumibacter petaseus NBRC 106054]